MSTDISVCKNCGNSFTGKFCNECGQKAFEESDKRVLRFIEEGLHFVTHFDGTIFTTLKRLLTRPGQLSADYTDGRQKQYFRPMSFFLLLVILYLLFPLVEGLNMRLQFHMNNRNYGEFATQQVNSYLQHHPGLKMEQLQNMFAQKSEKTSKILLLIIVPTCALVLWALSFFRRRYFYDQMVLSAEINSFYLLSNFFLLPGLFLLVWHTGSWLGWEMPGMDDYTFTTIGQVITAVFAAAAFRRFYRFGVPYTVIATCIFMFFHDFIVYVLYKFVLFIIAFNLIH